MFGSGGNAQVAVGVNDVWFATGGVWFTYTPISGSVVPFGLDLNQNAPQVATGGDGVWVIVSTTSNEGQVSCNVPVGSELICRYDFQQQTFLAVPGLISTPAQIAAGSGAGVWAIDSGNRVYTFVRP
jgi:hypothetical protein